VRERRRISPKAQCRTSPEPHFLHILKVAFRFESRMTPIRATPARRSKPVIPPLDREHPLREAPFAAGRLRQRIHNQQFLNAAGSARPV
jgi:hypothetical protein